MLDPDFCVSSMVCTAGGSSMLKSLIRVLTFMGSGYIVGVRRNAVMNSDEQAQWEAHCKRGIGAKPLQLNKLICDM